MKKSVKLGVVLIALTLIVGAFVALSAQSTRSLQGSPTAGMSSKLPPPPTLIFNRKLISTTQSYDNSFVAVGPGFSFLDAPLKFTCPGPTTCTASAEQNVQVNGSTGANRWAICTTLDGSYSGEPLCPYLGIVPSDGTYVAGAFTENFDSVSPGTHTLQTQVYMDNGGNLSIYNITYRLYKP